jgi:hypothetical protein
MKGSRRSEWSVQPALRADAAQAVVLRMVPMRKIFGQSLMASLQQLDRESALRIRIFTWKLMVVVGVAMALAVPRGYPILAMIWVFALWQGVFTALAAAFRRQRFCALFLTAWDEAAAFIAIALLARLASA